MSPSKSQTQYDLTENSTFVSMSALLLVLENIKNDSILDTNHPCSIKSKGLKGSARLSWLTSVSKKNQGYRLDQKILPPLQEALRATQKLQHMWLPSFQQGWQSYQQDQVTGEPHSKNWCHGASFTQIVCAEFKNILCKQLHKCYKYCTNAQKVMMTLTKVPEVAGGVVLGNPLQVRNIN